MQTPVTNELALQGCLLGTAVGDAVGLAGESLSPQRQLKLFPALDRPHFFFGRGMCSDDTEHACLTAQALTAAWDDDRSFRQELAWRTRWWFAGLPFGIGMATVKACVRLWLGFGANRSGVFSAGNGPGMRAPVLGVALRHEPAMLKAAVHSATIITHTDPKAEYGALALAYAAGWAAGKDFSSGWQTRFLGKLEQELPDAACELLELVKQAHASAQVNESLDALVVSLGSRKGVSGYMYHTVPAILHVWFRKPLEYRSAIEEMVRAGGDADTTAAILGGIIGASVGKDGIPAEWLGSLMEWPRTVPWMESVARRTAEAVEQKQALKPVPLFWLGLIPRNLLFDLTVLVHGFRRLFPPY
ncbi:MAG: ADP-ribosylglycohydrolase family protein [Verrucomicrobiota bacterium]